MLYLSEESILLLYYLYPESERRGYVDSLDLLEEGSILRSVSLVASYNGNVPVRSVSQSIDNTCYLSVPRLRDWRHLIRSGNAEVIRIDDTRLYSPLHEDFGNRGSWLRLMCQEDAVSEVERRFRTNPQSLFEERCQLSFLWKYVNEQRLSRNIPARKLTLDEISVPVPETLALTSLMRCWGTQAGIDIMNRASAAELRKLFKVGRLRNTLLHRAKNKDDMQLLAGLIEQHVFTTPGLGEDLFKQFLLHVQVWFAQNGRWSISLTQANIKQLEEILCQN